MSNIEDVAEAIEAREVAEADETQEWTAPNGEVFHPRIPTLTQLMMFLAISQGQGTMQMVRGINRMLKALFKEPGEVERLQDLMLEGEVELEDMMGGEDSLLSFLIGLVSGGRPTRPSDESSSTSSEPVGKRSTGRSPGKGSTRSSSPSTDS